MNTITRISDVLRVIADIMDKEENHTIHYIEEHFAQPLQQCRILSNSEVAEMLKISLSQVSKLIKTGKLKTTVDRRVTEYHLRRYLFPNEQTNLTSQTT